MLADTFPHVAFSTTVRDLGLTLDQELSFSEHVNLTTRSCYYQLRQLRVVMRSLSHDAAVVLVHAFVTSRNDHSCSVLVGLPLGFIGRLYRVPRFTASLIGHIPKYASVSAYMRDVLHWLPVSQRILYRSSARGELLVPRARSSLKQRRAFSVIDPTCNQLPLTLRLLPWNNMSSFCKACKDDPKFEIRCAKA